MLILLTFKERTFIPICQKKGKRINFWGQFVDIVGEVNPEHFQLKTDINYYIYGFWDPYMAEFNCHCYGMNYMYQPLRAYIFSLTLMVDVWQKK